MTPLLMVRLSERLLVNKKALLLSWPDEQTFRTNLTMWSEKLMPALKNKEKLVGL
jgi:hypothetical protein